MRTSAVIERIKLLISAGRDGPQEEGPVIAEQYAALVKSANARLSECAGMLKAGMLSEALRKAEAFPPLLELCAELDIPEAGAWTDLCRGRRWSAAERIDASTVAAVTEAYSSQDAAEPLLRSFRKAALKRNLKQCVFLLRKLIALDPMREDWPKDLNAFEAKRLEQIALQAKLGDERGNEAVLGLLLMELNEEWLDPAAKPLRTAVQASLAKIQAFQTATKADALALSIVKGYHSLNMDLVERGCQALQDLAKTGDLRASPEREEKIREAVEWLADAKRQHRRDIHQRELIGKIEASLDRQDAVACHAAYTELTRKEYPLDESLRNRVLQLFDMQKRIDLQKHKRKVMVVVAALALLASGLLFGLLQLKYNVARDKLVVALQEAIQAEDPGKADELLARATGKSKRMARDVAVQGKMANIEAIRSRQQLAANSFKAAVAALKELKAAGYAGREEQAKEQVAAANANMQKGEAGNEFLLLLQDFEGHCRNRQAAADQVVIKAMTPLQDTLARLENEGDRGETTDKALDELNQALKADFPYLGVASETTKTAFEGLRTGVSSFSASIDAQRKQLGTLYESRNLQEYLAAAKAFTLAFPAAPESVRLNQYLELGEVYQAYASQGLAGEAVYGNSRKCLADLNEKWPDVKEAITGLERDRRMTMLTVGEVQGKKFFWEFWPNEERMETGVMGYGGLAYLPKPMDVEPTFERMVVPKGTVKLQLSPHCDMVRDLIVQCRMVSSGGEALPVLCTQLQKIASNEGVDPLLRFRIASFVADRIRDMVSEKTAPKLDQLCVDLSSIDPEVAWLCIATSSTKAGNEKAKVVLDQHFGKIPTTAAQVAFDLAIRGAVAQRGMAYVGQGSDKTPDGIKWVSSGPVAECFLMRKDKDGNPTVMLVGDRRGETFKVYLKPNPGEPVFAPTDGKTIWGILQTCRQSTNVGKLSVSADVRAWPANVK